MKKEGSIYILRNPYLKEAVIKIGRTSRITEKRAKEISSATGVPFEYEVLYEEDVLDSHLAEKLIHEKLTEKRINKKREFFNIPLKKAVKTVFEVCLEVNKKLLNQDSSRLYILVDEKCTQKGAPEELSSILGKHKGGDTEVFIEHKQGDVTAIITLGNDNLVTLSAELINELKNSKKFNDIIWASSELEKYPKYEASEEILF